MDRRYSLEQGTMRCVLNSFLAVVGQGVLFLLVTVMTYAQPIRPELPKLSLTGRETGYDPAYYPDGRIWVPAALGPNQPRYILVPVFIKNCWVTSGGYQARPIYSIRFKLQYDSSAFRAVGVQTRGQSMQAVTPMYGSSRVTLRLLPMDGKSRGTTP